jgi:peroxiredoxin
MRAYWLRVILSSFLALCINANAQTHKAPHSPTAAPTLRTLPEIPLAFDLDATKGRVVLIFHWRTDCPVCLDKMNELRSNMGGWRGKAFVIVAINHDKSRQNFQDYLRIQKYVNGENGQFIHLFNKDLAADSLYKNERLPTSFLLDSQKILKRTYFGRIPNEAWDEIAELIP